MTQPKTTRPKPRQAKPARASAARGDGKGEDASDSELARAWREFVAREPAEAKRQRREDKREAKTKYRSLAFREDSVRHASSVEDEINRRIDVGEKADGYEIAKNTQAAPSRPHARPAKRRGQVTGLQRGVATLTTDPLFAEHGFELAGSTLAPSVRDLPWPNDPAASDFRDKLAAVVAAQRPWHMVEYARFAAALFDGAEAFYREVRAAYSARVDLENDLAGWPAWTADDEIATLRANITFGLDGTLSPESQNAAARLKRLVADLPPPPKRLHRAWGAAKLRESGGRLRQVPRERGKGAASGREWPRFVRLEILVAGHRLLYVPELADQPGRVVKADLLSPRLTGFLCGPARRTGPKAAALEFVAEVMDRSPAQVEKLCTSARLADAAK